MKTEYKPLISVVTVCYNAENEIEATIESILNQSYKSIEYVIIDGKSTDATLEIIEKYRDNIDVLISEKDNGIYDAMNKSLNHINGEWVIFMNAGDTFSNLDVLKNIYLTDKIDNYDVIYGDTLVVDTAGNLKYLPAKSLDGFWKYTPFSHQSLLMRANCFQKDKFNTVYRVMADNELHARKYMDEFKFYYYNRPIAKYLSGGYSEQNRIYNVIERWHIAYHLTMVDKKEIDEYFIRAMSNAIKHDYPKDIPKRNIIKDIMKKIKYKWMKNEKLY